MFGKIFEDIFCSTLMDFGGDTAYVFIAMIVLSDESGVIKHTAESLARMICKDVDSVKKAVTDLELQDLKSNLQGHEGRRIVPLYEICEDETRGWLVVNKAHYRDKNDPNERKDYMREYMRKYREDKAVNTTLTPVNSGKPKLAHTDTDTDTDESRGAKRSHGSRLPSEWFPSTSLVGWSTKERPDLDLATVVAKFRDYWAGKPGKSGTKLDWDATFRNWVREEKPGRKIAPTGEII